jgi:hypothetical protein
MNTEVQIARTPHGLYLALGAFAAIVMTLGIGFALYEFVQIERDIRASAAASSQTIAMVNGALKGKHANGDDGYLVLTQRLLQNATGAANAIKQTMQDANAIAKAQVPKTKALADASVTLVETGNATVAKLGGSIDTLNEMLADVRRETLPKLNASIVSTDTAIDSLNGLVSDLRPAARASTDLIVAGTATISELKTTVGTANALLADPDLAAIAGNFKLLTGNGNLLMANLALDAMDVHHLLNPARVPFWEGIAKVAATSVLGAAAGPFISHFWPLSINVDNVVQTTLKPVQNVVTTSPAK